MNSIINKLFEWLGSKDGINGFNSWVLFTLIGGAIISLSIKFFQLSWKLISYKFIQSKKISEFIGEYYLYHPPLILGLNNLPRVSKLVLSSNWINPGKAEQFGIKPRKRVYQGKFEIHKTVISLYLNWPKNDCPKTIILWHFQLRATTRDKITFGTMCCINHNEEPYHVPIIVAESRLPRADVTSIFNALKKTTITRDIRRQIMVQASTCIEGDPNEEFEHIIVGPNSIGNERITSRFKDRILSFLSFVRR